MNRALFLIHNNHFPIKRQQLRMNTKRKNQKPQICVSQNGLLFLLKK